MQTRLVFEGGRFTALFTIIFTTKVSHVRYQLVSHLHESIKHSRIMRSALKHWDFKNTDLFSAKLFPGGADKQVLIKS